MLSFSRQHKNKRKDIDTYEASLCLGELIREKLCPTAQQLVDYYADMDMPVPHLQKSKECVINAVMVKRESAIQLFLKQNTSYGTRPQMNWAWKLAAIAIVITLMLFPVRGQMVVSAMDSLPGDALYLVKLAHEGSAVDMVEEPEVKALLSLSFADKRIEEMTVLAREGREIPISLIYRAHRLLNTSLSYAAWTDDTLLSVLEQIARHLQSYAYLLENAKNGTTEQNQSRLADMQGRCLRLQLIVTAASMESAVFRKAYQAGAPEKLTALSDPLGTDPMLLE